MVGPLVVPRLGVCPAVPVVAFACGGGKLAGGGIIDGEVKGVDLCAAVAVGVRVIVGARSVVGLAIAAGPGVGVVGGYRGGLVDGVVDGEVQVDDGVAALSVSQGEGRFICALGVGDAVDPGEGVAGYARVNAGVGVVDRQVQGVRAGATRGVGVVIREGAGSSVWCVVPCVAFACGQGFGIVCAVVDGQVQGDNAVSSVHIMVGPLVVPRLGVCPAVPVVAFACGGGKLAGGGVIDGEVKGIDLRATVVVGMRVKVGARSVVGLAVAAGPGIGVVGGDRGG